MQRTVTTLVLLVFATTPLLGAQAPVPPERQAVIDLLQMRLTDQLRPVLANLNVSLDVPSTGFLTGPNFIIAITPAAGLRLETIPSEPFILGSMTVDGVTRIVTETGDVLPAGSYVLRVSGFTLEYIDAAQHSVRTILGIEPLPRRVSVPVVNVCTETIGGPITQGPGDIKIVCSVEVDNFRVRWKKSITIG